MYRWGYRYKKAGVALWSIAPDAPSQTVIFPDPAASYTGGRHQLMNALDRVNLRYGGDTLAYAGMGTNPTWKGKRRYVSQRYTTEPAEVAVAGT